MTGRWRSGVTIITAQEVHEIGPAAVAARIREIVGDAPVYLSFDIDVLDPAFAPGTGTPEIGGLASWQAQAILRRLSGLPFVGMDVVEVGAGLRRRRDHRARRRDDRVGISLPAGHQRVVL